MPQRYSQGNQAQRNQKKYQQLPFQQARPQHSTESFHKTKLCKFYMEGRCARGPECKFAHSEDQLCEQPDLYRTRLCSAYLRGGRCPRGSECRFAHSEAELRRPSMSTSQSDQDLSDTALELDPDLDHRADSDEISENDGFQWVLWPIPSWNPWSGVLDGSEALAWDPDPIGEEEQLAWDPIGQLAWDPISNGAEVEKDESQKKPPHHPDCLAGLAALSQRYAGSEQRPRPAPLENVDSMKFSDFRQQRLDSKASASTQASSPTTSGKNLFAHGSQSDTQSEGSQGQAEDFMVDFAPVVKNTFLHFEEAGHDTEAFATLAKCRSEPLL